MYTRREKQVANRLVEKAIKSGKIKKQPCQVCKDKNAIAHHEDYSEPLSIVWLCRQHHVDIHSKNIRRFTNVYKKIFKNENGFYVRGDKYDIIKNHEHRVTYALKKAKELTAILFTQLGAV